MRCQPIRSVIRSFIAAGIIASSANAGLFASWKDFVNPLGGTCFIHDLEWDQVRSTTFRTSSTKPIDRITRDVLEKESRETELCMVAAREFELKTQVESVLSVLNARTRSLMAVGVDLSVNYSNARERVITSFASQTLKLVEWVQVPDALPLLAFVSDENIHLSQEWDCNQQNHIASSLSAPRFPARMHANLFIFAVSNSDIADTEISEASLTTDPCQATGCLDDEFIDEFEYNPEKDWSAGSSETFASVSRTDPSLSQSWQVGVDPVCREINERNPTFSWSESWMQPSVCCPNGFDAEAKSSNADSQPHPVATRPPVLEAEGEIPDFDRVFSDEEWNEEYLDLATEELKSINSEFDSNDFVAPDKSADQLENGEEDWVTEAFSPIAPTPQDTPPDESTKSIARTNGMKFLSRGVASKVRSVGQFLVNFALQIEEVEIAQQGNNRR